MIDGPFIVALPLYKSVHIRYGASKSVSPPSVSMLESELVEPFELSM